MRYVLNPLRSMAPMGEVARKLEADELTRDHLLPHSFAVRIPGSKTAESAATGRVGRAAVALGPTRRALKAAEADCDQRLHDLRHCTGQWLAEEGVERRASRRRCGMPQRRRRGATPSSAIKARTPTV